MNILDARVATGSFANDAGSAVALFVGIAKSNAKGMTNAVLKQYGFW